MIKQNSSSLELNKIYISYVNIYGTNIAQISTVHRLGVMFDSEMSMKASVSSINRSAFPQLKNLNAIKPFLDMEATHTVALAFVSSRLDAGNSILYGIAQGQL